MTYDPIVVRRSLIVVGIVAGIQAAGILVFPSVFVAPIFRRASEVGTIGWILCALCVAAYIAYSIRGLDLAKYMTAFPAFRIAGPLMAIPTGILEEIFFRKGVMDVLAHNGMGLVVQIVVSALIFGAAHAFWGIRGGIRAVVGATISTTLLGILLGVVYAASNRVVLPCIVAHMAINTVLEPWLVYAYVLRARAKTAAPNLF